MAKYRPRRASGNCVLCGAWRISLHRDHIIPKCRGGIDDSSNIQLLCANCHEDKTRVDLTGIPGPNLGRVFNEETRGKMAESARLRQDRGGHTKGLRFSDERRKAHSEALKRAFAAKPRVMPPASEERKRKVSEALLRHHAAKKAAAISSSPSECQA